MKIHFITDSINKRLAYILEQFLAFSVLDIEFVVLQPLSLVKPDNKNIYYLADCYKVPQAQGIFIYSSGNWQINSIARINCNYYGRDFFVLEEFSAKATAIEENEETAYVNFDLLGQAFYQLSCFREYALEVNGKGLRSNSKGIADKKIFEEPNVNTLFLILERLIAEKFAIERAKEKRYPSGKQFAVVLTHDIDTVKKSIKDRAKHAWHGLNRGLQLCRCGKLSKIPQEIVGTFAKVAGNKKYNNIGYLSALEEKNNLRSGFNVYVRSKRNKSGLLRRLYNPDYDISTDIGLREEIKKLLDKDFEIGIHGSYSSGQSISFLSEEVKILGGIVQRKILGGRQHFLDYSVSGTPEVFNAAAIEYDTSVGFRDINGFRAGACLPYYLYSLAADNMTDVLEIPLLIMDGVLFDRGDGVRESAWQSAKSILEKIKSAEGCCSVVWHQRVFNNQDYPSWEEVYLMLIAWVRDNNGVLLRPGDLNRFWRNKKKNKLTLV